MGAYEIPWHNFLDILCGCCGFLGMGFTCFKNLYVDISLRRVRRLVLKYVIAHEDLLNACIITENVQVQPKERTMVAYLVDYSKLFLLTWYLSNSLRELHG